ncbi:hypothetical protein U1Q18_040659 [Sarracenia purpurea var. burkii]
MLRLASVFAGVGCGGVCMVPCSFLGFVVAQLILWRIAAGSRSSWLVWVVSGCPGGGVVCALVCGGFCATVVPVFRGVAFAMSWPFPLRFLLRMKIKWLPD